jgi:two-component system nitrate/nitrite response regulator NarL
VDAYILKKDTHNNLKEALIKVVDGKKFLSEEVSQILMENPEKEKPKPVLTSRETEIVRLIADDKTNKEIAQELFISERTVETHRKNIMRKTQTGTVVSLLKYAREHGVL